MTPLSWNNVQSYSGANMLARPTLSVWANEHSEIAASCYECVMHDIGAGHYGAASTMQQHAAHHSHAALCMRLALLHNVTPLEAARMVRRG